MTPVVLLYDGIIGELVKDNKCWSSTLSRKENDEMCNIRRVSPTYQLQLIKFTFEFSKHYPFSNSLRINFFDIYQVPGERFLGSYAFDDVNESVSVHLPATSEVSLVFCICLKTMSSCYGE